MISALLTLCLAPTNYLKNYLRTPEPAYEYRVTAKHSDYTDLSLTSQDWQGFRWKHSMIIAEPNNPVSSDTAILYITGDRRDGDLPIVMDFAETSRMPVVTLFDVPNQPIFDEREDALIAITFGKYLETHDPKWPLLFPMTKAAIKAMDAAQAYSGGRFKHFIVTGASKRGWTTWLVGASGDKRVKGIAPMVIDMLNMPKQLKYQMESWGHYSPEIEDYSKTGLTEAYKSEDGQNLIKMVDPYSYLRDIKVPVLIVTGSNDRYWTVDAHRLYWDDIKAPKLMRVCPNVGHDLGGGRDAIPSISFFARSLAGAIPGGLPRLKGDKRLKAQREWTASSASLDFHSSEWAVSAPLNEKLNQASFTEYQYSFAKLSASFTSLVSIKKKSGSLRNNH